MTTAAEICTQAAALVSGERARQHGDKRKNHQNIALLWQAYLDCRDERNDLSARDVAMMMVLLKMARTQTGALNLDDYLDMVGYASIGGELAQ